jgi:hypothetical protein
MSNDQRLPFTQDLFTSRRNFDDGTTRLGELHRIWYDSETNTLRIGDGATPGGKLIVGASLDYLFPNPQFHGFNRVDDELIYTVIDSGDIRLQDFNGDEIYDAYDIGTNQYTYFIDDNGELILRFLEPQ